jgi:hypothetical protein
VLNSLPAITGLVVAITGLVGAITAMLVVVLQRTKKTQRLVNGHITSLIDILQKAEITLPSGTKIKYVPPNQSPDETSMLDYLEEIRSEVNDNPPNHGKPSPS